MSETQIIYEPFKTRPLDSFLEELRFEYPTLPAQLFQFYLLKAARNMARQGNLIRRRAAVNLEPCITRYRLESPMGWRYVVSCVHISFRAAVAADMTPERLSLCRRGALPAAGRLSGMMTLRRYCMSDTRTAPDVFLRSWPLCRDRMPVSFLTSCILTGWILCLWACGLT